MPRHSWRPCIGVSLQDHYGRGLRQTMVMGFRKAPVESVANNSVAHLHLTHPDAVMRRLSAAISRRSVPGIRCAGTAGPVASSGRAAGTLVAEKERVVSQPGGTAPRHGIKAVAACRTSGRGAGKSRPVTPLISPHAGCAYLYISRSDVRSKSPRRRVSARRSP
jgi:hypothetical protein